MTHGKRITFLLREIAQAKYASMVDFDCLAKKSEGKSCYKIEHFAGRPHGPSLPPSLATTGSCRGAVTAVSGSDAGTAPVLAPL